jgi:hypothetical protein
MVAGVRVSLERDGGEHHDQQAGLPHQRPQRRN